MSERPRSIEIVGESLSAAMKADAPKRTKRRWPLGLAFAATSVVAVLLVLSLTARNGKDPFTVESAIAAVTQAAYEIPKEHPNEYLYMKSTETFVGENTALFHHKRFAWRVVSTRERQTWTRPGSESWLVTGTTHTDFATAEDRAERDSANALQQRFWRKSHSGRRAPNFLPSISNTDLRSTHSPMVCRVPANDSWFLGGREISDYFMARSEELPTTAREMYDFLDARIGTPPRGQSRAGMIWRDIDFATRTSAKTSKPEHRAALIGALALIPGVETFGETVDPAGREAIGFSRAARGRQTRIYFDRATGLTSFSDYRSVDGKPIRGGFTWRLDEFKYVSSPPNLKESDRSQSLQEFIYCPFLNGKRVDGINEKYRAPDASHIHEVWRKR